MQKKRKTIKQKNESFSVVSFVVARNSFFFFLSLLIHQENRFFKTRVVLTAVELEMNFSDFHLGLASQLIK